MAWEGAGDAAGMPNPSRGIRQLYSPDQDAERFRRVIDALLDARRLFSSRPRLGFGTPGGRNLGDTYNRADLTREGFGGRGLGQYNPGAPGSRMYSVTDQMLADYGRPTGP